MQNFIAVALFAGLVAVVFFPDEILKNDPTASKLNSTQTLQQNEGFQKPPVIQSGTGVVLHYIGIEERNTGN